MKTLAIIPARGGSKGIPDKNIRTLGGKPLIAWTIKAALEAGGIDRVIVSTDSQKILGVAQVYGAETPFVRPQEIALDNTPGVVPIIHAAQWMIDHDGYLPDYVVCLQPTSPFRSHLDIDQAIQLLKSTEAESVVSITRLDHNPNWMLKMDKEGRLVNFIAGGTSVNTRQEMEPVYELNGAIYLIRTDILLKRKTFFVDEVYGYIMPKERSIDIDTPWDFYLADLVAKDMK
jgi:N-acylneuraminate cytidylyltransferase/CMP-N,N'-diacetyllegionaminic acid synthase